MATYYALPRIVSICHAPHLSTRAITRAIQHARSASIDNTSAIVGGVLSYDGNGRPVDCDSPDAEILEAMTIEVEYARVARI